MNETAKTESPGRNEPLIDFGWLVMDRLDAIEETALRQVRDRMLKSLQQQFPHFRWRMPLLQRRRSGENRYQEPVELLQQGIHERDIHHWDFALVITRNDLKSYYKPYALGVPSRAVAVAVLSLARLLPEESETEPQQSAAHLAVRWFALAMHLFGDLNGILHNPEHVSFMYEPAAIDDLDSMRTFSEDENAELVRALDEVADTRLEERPWAGTSGWLRFYGQTMAIGWREILSAILQAKPWQFPFRLSRLTTAGVSTMMILIMTAEVWDLAVSQPGLRVLVLSLASILGTSLFVIKRQNVLLYREPQRLTEQTVITRIAVSIVIVLGMATTYCMLFVLVLLLAGLFYSPALIHGWATALQGEVEFTHYMILAAFIASLGVIIGALGASFEGQFYFRHITYVDEET